MITLEPETMTCPNCCAGIEFDENSEYAYCEYCGSRFLIKGKNTRAKSSPPSAPAPKAMSEAELSRHNTQAVEDYIKTQSRINDLQRKTDESSQELTRLRHRKSRLESRFLTALKSIPPVLILAAVVLYLMICNFKALFFASIGAAAFFAASKIVLKILRGKTVSDEEGSYSPNEDAARQTNISPGTGFIDSAWSRILPFIFPSLILIITILCIARSRIAVFIAIGTAVLIFVISGKTRKKHLEKVTEQIENTEPRLEELETEMKKARANLDEELIPPEHRNLDSLNGIYGFLRSGRAVTIREAINLYEDKKEREHAEQLRREEEQRHWEELDAQRREYERRISEAEEREKSKNAAATVGKVLIGVTVAAKIFKHLK